MRKAKYKFRFYVSNSWGGSSYTYRANSKKDAVQKMIIFCPWAHKEWVKSGMKFIKRPNK